MDLPEELELLFIEHDYQWKIDGKLVQPTTEIIQDALDKAVEALYAEEPQTQLEVGRLIVKKRTATLYDVFAMIGEINV